MSKWKMVRLGEVCEIISGTTPKSYNSEYWGGTINWITPAEIKNDTYIIYESERKITELAVKETGLKPFPEGTVILSSRAPIGKVAIAGKEMYCNQGFKNMICSANIDNKYLFWFLKSKTIYLNSLGRGATFKEISKAIVENVEIPLPPLDEQKRIAEELNKISGLIAKRKCQLEKLDLLIKAKFVEMFGDPVTNPMGWDRSTLKQSSFRLSDGPFGSNLKSEHYTNDGVRVIRLQNIGVGNFVNKDKAYVSQAHYETIKKYTCRAGDLVIATLGEPNLRACIIPKTILFAINKADCVHYIPNPSVLNSLFTCQYLNLPAILNLASDKMHGQTRTRISSGQVAQLPIFLPPIDLQNQFGGYVTKVEQTKTKLQQGLEQLEILYKARMQEYFE